MIPDELIKILKNSETTDFLEEEERRAVDLCLGIIFNHTVWDNKRMQWIFELTGERISEENLSAIVDILGQIRTYKIRKEGFWYGKEWKRVKGKTFIEAQHYYGDITKKIYKNQKYEDLWKRREKKK